MTDCPCHGSRYDYDGHVIQHRMVRDLEPKPLSGDSASGPPPVEE